MEKRELSLSFGSNNDKNDKPNPLRVHRPF